VNAYAQCFEEIGVQIAASDEALAWLMRIELRCAVAWAEAYAARHACATILASSREGEPSNDERDWRRAWIEVRSRKFGTVPQWSAP
jgi:predicted kinase